ncbi:hypothetical protein NMG60_11014184 [Bertholletia excelsa]
MGIYRGLVGRSSLTCNLRSSNDLRMEEIRNENGTTFVTLRLQRQDEGDKFFRIRRDLPLRRLMLAYCERLGLHIDAVRFCFDGKRVKDSQTANDLEMKDGDVIDAFSDMLGAGGGSYASSAVF